MPNPKGKGGAGKPREKKPLSADLDPWEKQPNESGPAFQAFAMYRDDTIPRSTRRIARELDKDHTLIGKWSSEWSWPDRVAAWDREQDRAKRAANLDATAEMARRQATQAQALQTALIAPVQELLSRMQRTTAEGDNPFEDWDVRELARVAEAIARPWSAVATFERLARGLSTSNVGGQGGVEAVESARAAAEQMSRSELEGYLLGFDDGVVASQRPTVGADG